MTPIQGATVDGVLWLRPLFTDLYGPFRKGHAQWWMTVPRTSRAVVDADELRNYPK